MFSSAFDGLKKFRHSFGTLIWQKKFFFQRHNALSRPIGIKAAKIVSNVSCTSGKSNIWHDRFKREEKKRMKNKLTLSNPMNLMKTCRCWARRCAIWISHQVIAKEKGIELSPRGIICGVSNFKGSWATTLIEIKG